MPSKVTQQELENVQLIIEKLARREIDEEEAQRLLEEIWERAYHEPLLRTLLRELLPALKTRKRGKTAVG